MVIIENFAEKLKFQIDWKLFNKFSTKGSSVTQMALTTCDWPNSYKYAFWAVFFAWLGMVHAWIAFKAELFPMDFYRYCKVTNCTIFLI